MSQIGLSQLCRGLALSALLVQGYWNCFDLASPSWIETTRKLNCCRKRLKILLVPSAKCTSYSPSPHPILSLTLYISPILSLISCSITFYTSSTLPPLSFYLSLFLYYSKPPPNEPHVESWAQMSQREHDTKLIGQHHPEKVRVSLWPQLDEYVCVAAEPKVRTFLSFSAVTQTCVCLQADTASVLC